MLYFLAIVFGIAAVFLVLMTVISGEKDDAIFLLIATIIAVVCGIGENYI